jgi:hypothetical protein
VDLYNELQLFERRISVSTVEAGAWSAGNIGQLWTMLACYFTFCADRNVVGVMGIFAKARGPLSGFLGTAAIANAAITPSAGLTSNPADARIAIMMPLLCFQYAPAISVDGSQI